VRTEQPVAISRHDYQAPAWQIPTVKLHFDLHPERTVVTSTLQLVRQAPGALCLDGTELTLLDIKLNGKTLEANDYSVDEKQLKLESLPDRAELEIKTH